MYIQRAPRGFEMITFTYRPKNGEIYKCRKKHKD